MNILRQFYYWHEWNLIANWISLIFCLSLTLILYFCEITKYNQPFDYTSFVLALWFGLCLWVSYCFITYGIGIG